MKHYSTKSNVIGRVFGRTKIVCLVLCAILALSGCSNVPSGDSSSPSEPAATPSPTPEPVGMDKVFGEGKTIAILSEDNTIITGAVAQANALGIPSVPTNSVDEANAADIIITDMMDAETTALLTKPTIALHSSPVSGATATIVLPSDDVRGAIESIHDFPGHEAPVRIVSLFDLSDLYAMNAFTETEDAGKLFSRSYLVVNTDASQTPEPDLTNPDSDPDLNEEEAAEEEVEAVEEEAAEEEATEEIEEETPATDSVSLTDAPSSLFEILESIPVGLLDTIYAQTPELAKIAYSVLVEADRHDRTEVIVSTMTEDVVSLMREDFYLLGGAYGTNGYAVGALALRMAASHLAGEEVTDATVESRMFIAEDWHAIEKETPFTTDIFAMVIDPQSDESLANVYDVLGGMELANLYRTETHAYLSEYAAEAAS